MTSTKGNRRLQPNAPLLLPLPPPVHRVEGYRGFYRGWVANTIKVVPQNAIRMVSYELLKSMLGIKKAKTDT